MPNLKKSPPLNCAVRREDILLTEDDKLRVYANAPTEQYVPKQANDQTAPESSSFLDVCERAKKHKTQILTFFHDHFFGGGERELHLSHPEFIDCTQKISDFAETFGIGIGASVTNPLDLGRTFKQDMGVGGQHRFFSEGVLHPDGTFSFNAMLSEKWCNNKGYIYPKFDHARLFAYTELDDGSPYLVIDPASICEIPAADYTCTLSYEPYELSQYFGDKHMEIKGKTSLSGNRVFAVFYMDTPEMDYFHPKAVQYVHGVIDMYREKGVEFMELYSDEMHIQFDWDLGTHFGPYEIPTRYMTANFEAELAKIDPIFADFDRALIYFGYDMHIDRATLGRSHTQHVLGSSKAELVRTFRLRKTYFEMLSDRVVNLCCDARDYVRDTYVKNAGWDPFCVGHATWQESPTCDKYGPGNEGMFNLATINGYCAYDYSPAYVYSSTIREAISGCYDYFKWNDYFSYGGTDFCESGWFDRNYYGGAMSASLGSLNRNEVCLWGAWGFPDKARRRFAAVQNGFGAHIPREGIVTYNRPRDTEVLYIYPKDLTMIEERFGSWMVQYAYANYCPADRVTTLGKIENGKLILGICSYTTVAVGFEPFYDEAFLTLLERFAKEGGRVVWNATPPADKDGNVPNAWLKLFGLHAAQTVTEGGTARTIRFAGLLSGISPMCVPTDMLPDRVYKIAIEGDAAPVAYADQILIGATRQYGKGSVTYLGCRLRDDQSGESGDAPSTLFDVLKALGAYGGKDCVDSPEAISRKTPYFATKFPNGAYSLCHHYYTMKELWPLGMFRRRQEEDQEFMETYDLLVPTALDFESFSLDGHSITYKGEHFVQYRLDKYGNLIGFRGDNTCGITIDGTVYKITDAPANTAFGLIENCRIPDGYRMGWMVDSNAPVVDICTPIPDGAELYLSPGAVGNELIPDISLSYQGSKICKGNAKCVVVLVK